MGLYGVSEAAGVEEAAGHAKTRKSRMIPCKPITPTRPDD
ncbi:hypothetical protein HMPREF1314_1692 [Bifidobacterium longum subsp. longum 35B]|uniref:Uncharacterized protein n=1 Tax=Bifidobacterium longum subsp. longum 2-2B TaxID=1161745 RepID=A0AAV3FNF4_BIFLL|nr:hypothetical protein HMPREF1314_1692 [Bifidobacterium longum subsp. longum 35B]EIJ26481.1 hypothetical protein HMPREF1315_0077 [Bifidobacterium longum subsp. longum 2-2B]